MNLTLFLFYLHASIAVAQVITIEIGDVRIPAKESAASMQFAAAATQPTNASIGIVFQQAFDILSESCDLSHYPFRLEYAVKDIGEGVLASASASFKLDWHRECWLPLALTKLEESETAAVSININSRLLHVSHWDTDGNCSAPHKYDLLTIILHELVHGLAAYDSFNITDVVSAVGWNEQGQECDKCKNTRCWPTCFDLNIVNETGCRIVDACNVNPWQSLYVRGTKLYRQTVKNAWDIGIGLSHVADSQSLMYPQSSKGRCLHGLDASSVNIINTVSDEKICRMTYPRESKYKYSGLLFNVKAAAGPRGVDVTLLLLPLLLTLLLMS
mgnify:CR=1 FL=1